MIVIGELIGQTRVQLATEGKKTRLGVLSVDDVVKGDSLQTVVLLVLPSSRGPMVSSDIPLQIGQKGLWFLHPRSEDEVGLYVVDHPQRFLPSDQIADRIGEIRRVLENQKKGQ